MCAQAGLMRHSPSMPIGFSTFSFTPIGSATCMCRALDGGWGLLWTIAGAYTNALLTAHVNLTPRLALPGTRFIRKTNKKLPCRLSGTLDADQSVTSQIVTATVIPIASREAKGIAPLSSTHTLDGALDGDGEGDTTFIRITTSR